MQADTGGSNDGTSFTLEVHLREFLSRNLETVEKGLKLFHDETQREGIEYATSTGPIDILATDKNGNFVVFELKVNRGPDKAIGQLMRYMGWVHDNVAQGKLVRGFIVARLIDDSLKYANKMANNIQLLEYEIRFTLKSAQPINS